MSYLLLQKERYLRPEPLRRLRAAVMVKSFNNRLIVVEGSIFIAQPDTTWWPVPDRLHVVDPDGMEIEPSKGCRFYISAETFDPYHAVLEAEHVPL